MDGQQLVLTTKRGEHVSSRRLQRQMRTSVWYVVMGALGLTCIFPLLWMLSTSFKERGLVFVYPPQWVPRPVTVEGYVKLFTYIPFFRQLANTLLVAGSVTLGELICCSLAGYAFARIAFPARDKIFLAYLATLMVPSQVTLIPGFMLMKYLGWIDTYYALIVPGLLGSAFGTFLLRQFFMTVPVELENAAFIDGANHFQVYRVIMLPQVKPALATLGLFTFVGQWNNFLWPLIVTNSQEHMTLTVSIAILSLGEYSTNWPAMMAGASLAIAPLLAVFFFTQRYFVEGIALTGMKM